MKIPTAKYSDAVAWIAENDEPTLLEEDQVASMISTQLVGDIFNVGEAQVAWDVVRYRYNKRTPNSKKFILGFNGKEPCFQVPQK